jgi:hypothetical protein
MARRPLNSQRKTIRRLVHWQQRVDSGIDRPSVNSRFWRAGLSFGCASEQPLSSQMETFIRAPVIAVENVGFGHQTIYFMCSREISR